MQYVYFKCAFVHENIIYCMKYVIRARKYNRLHEICNTCISSVLFTREMFVFDLPHRRLSTSVSAIGSLT